MHGVRTELLRAQAEAAGLPLVIVSIPSPCPNEVYEERMAAACRAAVADGFTHVAFGDLFLEDVRRYREERLAASGLVPLFPLWNRPTPALAREMIAGGLEARLTSVDPRAIPASFAGRAFDRSLLADLPATADPCGERGEFHTCVTAGPMFSRPIPACPALSSNAMGSCSRTSCRRRQTGTRAPRATDRPVHPQSKRTVTAVLG